MIELGGDFEAHPRSRGENLAFVVPIVLVGGSSPLTRGKPYAVTDTPPPLGLIPAHAGKTRGDPRRPHEEEAHPRSRGENHPAPRGPRTPLGSSPLTRGKPMPAHVRSLMRGLIPAHAGKTSWFPGRTSVGRAHPRSRGENSRRTLEGQRPSGSSPLTRGKHFLTCAFIAQIGQILESLELCASSESYSSPEAYATDALQGRVRSIDLGLRSSRGAS